MKPIEILHPHHLARAVSSVEATTDFYCNVLGFSVLPRPPFSFPGAWLFGHGIQIHLIENAELTATGRGIDTRGNHTAFAVADIEAARTTLEASGIKYREQVNAGGAHQIFFHDPDGNDIEIAKYADPDPSKGYQG